MSGTFHTIRKCEFQLPVQKNKEIEPRNKFRRVPQVCPMNYLSMVHWGTGPRRKYLLLTGGEGHFPKKK